MAYAVDEEVGPGDGDETHTSSTVIDAPNIDSFSPTLEQANPVLQFFDAQNFCSSNDNSHWLPDVDGTAPRGTAGLILTRSTTVNIRKNAMFAHMTAEQSAASHTFKIRARNDLASTTTIDDDSNGVWQVGIIEWPVN